MSLHDVQPLVHFEVITKSDSTTYDPPLRAILVGTSGNLAVIGEDDAAAVTITGVAAGVWHRMKVTKIMSTNTTAVDICGAR